MSSPRRPCRPASFAHPPPPPPPLQQQQREGRTEKRNTLTTAAPYAPATAQGAFMLSSAIANTVPICAAQKGSCSRNRSPPCRYVGTAACAASPHRAGHSERRRYDRKSTQLSAIRKPSTPESPAMREA